MRDTAESTAPTLAAQRRDAEALSTPVLADIIRTAWYGVAVLDAQRRYLYVNPAGCRLLGSILSDLTGSVSPFPLERRNAGEDSIVPEDHHTPVMIEVEGTERVLDFTENGFGTGAERRSAVTFWDISKAQLLERRLAAFARTSSTLAYQGSLQVVLDGVATDVLVTTGAKACALLLIDPTTHSFTMAGTAGLAEEYLERVELCRRLGAPLVSLKAYEERRPLVRRDVRDLVMDERFAPIRTLIQEAGWTSAVGVPLIARDRQLGSLTVFYPESHDPDDDDVMFLTSISEQVAVAVDNAQLVTALQGKAALEERHRLARELHDSVSQALFSMNLQARAVELAVQQAGGDPDGKVSRGLTELRTLTEGALAEMRALIFQLRPEALHEEGLVTAVRKHTAAVAARSGVELAVHAEADRLPLPEAVEAELLRVIQEAVHNCVKHGSPEHVDVWLNEDPDAPGTLVVEVDDDGVGFNPDAPHPGHIGLESMRERTERLGGRLVIESSVAGSQVRAVLPAVLRTAPDTPQGAGVPE